MILSDSIALLRNSLCVIMAISNQIVLMVSFSFEKVLKVTLYNPKSEQKYFDKHHIIEE